MQCLARHTAERKNIPELKFENKPKFGFFLTARCKGTTTDKLCEPCKGREARIPALLEKWKGSMQNQSEQIHGLIGEAIPEWSRIYKGPYYLGKIEAGWRISEESQRKAEEAYTKTEKLVEMAPKKKVAEPVPVAEPAPVAEPKLQPKPEPEPVAKPKKRPPPKKKTAEPTAFIDATPQPEVEILTIKVKPTEIDGRKVYLSNLKDKVYDLKYNYLGRYNRKADRIETAYADSDG
jgi:hypothetical protein